MPFLYHVVACAEERVIGHQNKLPWHFSADLKNFKKLTTGSTVLMGRKTFESIGKPLPGRENFVLTRNADPEQNKEHLFFFDDLEKAFMKIQTPEAYIIGGSEIFAQTLHRIHGIYLTKINAFFPGDAYYPAIPNMFLLEERSVLQSEGPLIELLFYRNSRPPIV